MCAVISQHFSLPLTLWLTSVFVFQQKVGQVCKAQILALGCRRGTTIRRPRCVAWSPELLGTCSQLAPHWPPKANPLDHSPLNQYSV